MNPIPSTFISALRFDRLKAWARLTLLWMGALMFAPLAAGFNRRRIARYQHMTLSRMANTVARLILIRAAVMYAPPRRHRRTSRPFAPEGVRQRATPQHLVRSAIRSRIRRALRHRDPGQRLAILLGALVNIDALARKLYRRLTRLRPLIIARPPARKRVAKRASPRARRHRHVVKRISSRISCAVQNHVLRGRPRALFRRHRLRAPEIDAHQLRQTLLWHRDAIEPIHPRHRHRIVGDHDKARCR